MIPKPSFYMRLDYRAIYIGYKYPDNNGREHPYSPSGIEFMQSTISFIRENHNLLVGRWTVELMFSRFYDSPDNECEIIRGRNLTTGLPDEVCVSMQAINDNLKQSINGVASNISLNLEHWMPSDVYEALLESELVLQDGDFPLLSNFIAICEAQLPVVIVRDKSSN